MKVIIIGGGASGMMAALSASEDPNNTVTVLERQNRVGKKLMATGNGRCNLTNKAAAPSFYHGLHPEFIRSAFEQLPVEKTLEIFRKLGLYTVMEDSGKYYPLSDQANSVVDTLRFALEQRGVNIVTSCDVLSVHKKARGYQLETTGEKYFADKLIVACGGCAGKALGGTRSGYKLLASLGHSCTDLSPSLVQVKTDLTYVRSLKGVRADCTMTLKASGRVVQQTSGEVQFTDFGVSGPVTFELSRAVSVCKDEMVLLLDFMKHYTEEQLVRSLCDRAQLFPELHAEQLLTGMLNTRLGLTVVKSAGLNIHDPLKTLSDMDLCKVAHALKYFPLKVEGTLGMEHAQVTAGGVPTAEFRADTLESRLAPGVFAAGEVLDIDGDCGGFNLQWAWSSGYLAGKLGRIEDNI